MWKSSDRTRASHVQQSLHRLHRSQRWFPQASKVQYTQMETEGSLQIEQINTLLPFIPATPLGVRRRRLLANDTSAALRFLISDFEFLIPLRREILKVIS
jgi:hypothetical protein